MYFWKQWYVSNTFFHNFFSMSNKGGWGGMCFIPPHYIIPLFPLCWMAIRNPHAKLGKQQHLAPWQNPPTVMLTAFLLCPHIFLYKKTADGFSSQTNTLFCWPLSCRNVLVLSVCEWDLGQIYFKKDTSLFISEFVCKLSGKMPESYYTPFLCL